MNGAVNLREVDWRTSVITVSRVCQDSSFTGRQGQAPAGARDPIGDRCYSRKRRIEPALARIEDKGCEAEMAEAISASAWRGPQRGRRDGARYASSWMTNEPERCFVILHIIV